MTIQQLRYFLALCEDLNYTHPPGGCICPGRPCG